VGHHARREPLPASRYQQEDVWQTAGYLAKRYLASRLDQLKYTSVAAVTALLQTALEGYEQPRGGVHHGPR